MRKEHIGFCQKVKEMKTHETREEEEEEEIRRKRDILVRGVRWGYRGKRMKTKKVPIETSHKITYNDSFVFLESRFAAVLW